MLVTAAITGASLKDVATGKAGGPKNLGGDGQSVGAPSEGGASTQSYSVPNGSLTSPKGTVTFDGKPVAAWIAPALSYARNHGWNGTVTSGYRSFADQSAIYNSGVRPAAKPGTSNHESDVFPGGAVDVTDAQGLANALKGSPWSELLVWAGSKDPVHFSFPHNGSY
jgi:hypothetical protein